MPIMKFCCIDDHYNSLFFQILVLCKVVIFASLFYGKEPIEKRGGGGQIFSIEFTKIKTEKKKYLGI